MSPKAYRRGYPVAVLSWNRTRTRCTMADFQPSRQTPTKYTLKRRQKRLKAIYNFHELIINALRPILKEGVRSIIVASPPRTNFAQEFLNHLKGHHTWLFQGANKTTFSLITGSARHATSSCSLNKNINLQAVNPRKRH